ncbi:putative T7SS-secreted protein [Actinophytocola sediminis]
MSSRNVKDLVPGDPAEIWLLADSYNRMATSYENVGDGFRALDDGGWSGRAAEAFHARFEQQPRRFLAMADSYSQVAVALDTYAATLAWAQRQAGELIATDKLEPAPAARPVLTMTQQAELTGVITGADEPDPVRVDQRELAVTMYRRALAMVESVGNDSAASISAAAELLPVPLSEPVTVTAGHASVAEPAIRAVLRPPAARTWFDPATLRDDPHDWAVAIAKVRKRLRWDGLDRLSPRLAQHIFYGHYRPSKERCTGYHHREGGVDGGGLRVAKIIAGPDQHGVYKAQVCGPHIPSAMTKVSMFFPDSWSRAEVLHAVRQAFLDAMRHDGYDATKRRFRGTYRDVLIEGHLKSGPAVPRICDIVTAYPRGVRKPREPS